AKLGPYKIITLLGAGAMGRVYKGLDEHLDRLVAIKVLSKYLAADNENLERFHREAKILASIVHPNIAMIYYFGNLGGLPFFCMEYLPGGSVESLLGRKRVLDTETAVSYTMQVALGLNKALEKGIVHFDVKPSNMMIAENDRIKIVDFGLAHTHRELESALSSIVGSPAYVAPEQIEGGILDHRCDIYSLGVSFFEMLYGYVPITGKTVQEIFTRKVNAPFPSPETLDASVPLELYEIILRMSARDPARRYGNYSEIVEDLERFRRSRQKGVPFEMAPPPESTLRMQGQLYDRPFGEVLAEIARRNLSGKLTLSWIDLCKTIHFKDGQIIAVLSNQEGERFIDLLLARQEFSGEKARKFRSASFDLFKTYSSMIEEVSVENRGKLAADVYALAKEILSGMFSWEIGEFLFEEGKFPAQMNLQIDPLETV
ncbi:MAG TPA: protein kinase, partial [Acidobacteriota bacterium]